MTRRLTRWEEIAAWVVAGAVIWITLVPDTISPAIFLTGAACVVVIEVLSALFWRDRRSEDTVEAAGRESGVGPQS